MPENVNQRQLPQEIGAESTEEPKPGVERRLHRDHIALYVLVVGAVCFDVAVFDVDRPEEAQQREH